MSENRTRRNILAAAIAGIFSGGAQTAISQQTADPQALEEITVTGSRIRQTDGMTTPIPVTVLTTDELSNFDPGGTVAEQLDALPQFLDSMTAQRNAGKSVAGNAYGSFLNMRSLGLERTLVLFDGSRVVPADKQGGVNVDTFPTALIRTVDVVTGGASAAYGADAVGGVVNFVLNREFEGLSMQVGSGINEWGDGQRWNFSVAGGRQIGDSTHVIGSFQALHIDQIWRDPKDLGSWWQRTGWVTNPAWSSGAPAGVPQRITVPHIAPSEFNHTGVIWARTGASRNTPLIASFPINGYTFLEDGSAVRPFDKGNVYAGPSATGSTRTLSGGREAEAYDRVADGGPEGNEVASRSAFAAIKHDFTDSISGFAQVMAGRVDSTDQNMRDEYRLRDQWFATVYRDNAFLPPQVAAAMDTAGITSFQLHKNGSVLGAMDPGRGTLNTSRFTTISWSVGMDLALSNGWDFKASWQSGSSDKPGGGHDEVRVDRMFLGMDAVRDPATGAIVCKVQLFNPTPQQLAAAVAGRESKLGGPLMSPVGLDNSIRDCVPYNVMDSTTMSRPQVRDYTTSPITADHKVWQDFAEAVMTGDLIENSFIGPVSFATGFTWRDQEFEDVALERDIQVLGPPLNAPQIGIRGIPTGYTGGSPNLHAFSTVGTINGQYDVWEWFGELAAPTVWESASGGQNLGGSVAYRSSDYSIAGRIESWKMGADFQVFDDLRLRATKSRDAREATFRERFDISGGTSSFNDPRFNNALFSTSVLVGGNPALRPEIADTLVMGLVYQPGWLDGLSMSADWYEIEISDAVSSLGVQRIVNECENNGVASLCALIDRDPSNDNVVRVANVFVNVDQARAEGVDMEINYNLEPDFLSGQNEMLGLRAMAGYISERSNTPLGGLPFDVAGELGTPDMTVIATATYNVGPYGVQLQQRYIADTILDANWVEGVDVDKNTVSSGNYTNLRLSYGDEIANGGTWNVSLNVNNLFDRDPPIVAGAMNQVVPNGYEIFGRRYQLSLSMTY